MALNWNIEVIMYFAYGIITLVLMCIFYIKLKNFRFKSMFYFRVCILFLGIYWIIEGTTCLLIDSFLADFSYFLAHISYLLFLPKVIFFIIYFNLQTKDSYYSISLFILFILIPVNIIIVALPNSVEIIQDPLFGYLKFAPTDLLGLFNEFCDIVLVFYVIYGGILVWRNSPFLYKREALILLLSILFIIPVIIFTGFLTFWNQIIAYINETLAAIFIVILIYIIMTEPRLFYILHLNIHRIVVKDHVGHPLFDYDWSESNIGENVFAGFITALQIMTEEVMQVGRLLEIKLQEGYLIVYDLKYIIVGLAVSKPSKLLRDCLKNFAIDFEEQFEYLLKTSCKDKKKYETAYLLIDKHFSNFPYRVITSKHQPLLVSREYGKIPLLLDDKYNQIFQNEEDLEQIKAELLRSPVSSHNDFLELYKELKDEKDINFDEEAEILPE